MKKTKFIIGVVASAVLIAMTGCSNFDLRDEDERAAVNDIDNSDDDNDGGDEDDNDNQGGDITTITADWKGSFDSTAWWTNMATGDIKIENNKALVTEFKIKSATTTAWFQLPCVVLRDKSGDDSGAKEYAVVRGDNYGWCGVDNTGNALEKLGWKLTNDWDVKDDGAMDGDKFCTFTSGADCKLTVTVSNKKTTVLYELKKDNVTHYQKYEDIATDGDVYCMLKGDAGTSIQFLNTTLKSLVILEKPTLKFATGTDFSAAGIKVLAVYSDGSTKELGVADLDIDSSDYNKDEAKDGYKIIVKVKGEADTVKTEYNVNVRDITINNISVTTKPTKMTYNTTAEFRFDPTGIVVTADYSDDTSAPVPADDLKFTFGSVSNKNQTVTVNYSGKSDTFDVDIVEQFTIDGNCYTAQLYDTSMNTYVKDVGGKSAIDAHAAQVTTPEGSHFQETPKIAWDNPLFGNTDLTGATVSVKLHANAENANNFDAVLTFAKSTTAAWDVFGICERGGAHINSTKGWNDIVNYSIANDTWTTVTYVFEATTVKIYFGAELQGTITGTCPGDSYNAEGSHLYDLLNTMDKIGVGIGFNADWLAASYVDEGTAFTDFKIFDKALTAEEVAALN